MSISMDKKKLFSTLNEIAYETLNEAVRITKSSGHGVMKLEHWLLAMLHSEKTDFSQILENLNQNRGEVEKHLRRALGRLPKYGNEVSEISPTIVDVIEQAVLVKTMIGFGTKVRTGHILIALLSNNNLRKLIEDLSRVFLRIEADDVSERFSRLTPNSIEWTTIEDEQMNADPTQIGELQNDVFEQYCEDLTSLAQEGKIDAIIGRDDEVRQIVDILARRRQNNAMLVGEAGVGKTAIAEAFALKIASGDVHENLKNVRLMSLDIARLQAGAGIRGEFEERLKSLIDAIRSSETPIILFVDEAHTLIGAGGDQGTGDAGNLLKPMLARGEVRVIGATTWSEYKQYIEPDAALTRRFQTVFVAEPNTQTAIKMIRAVADKFAKFHDVIVLDDAIESAVNLSARYLHSRQLPDKAVSLLDTACARVALSQASLPKALEDALADVADQERLIDVFKQKSRFTDECVGGLESILKNRDSAQSLVEDLRMQLAEQRRVTAKIKELYFTFEDNNQSQIDFRNAVNDFSERFPEALVYPWVNAQTVASVVSDWTGIPCHQMLANETQGVLSLEDKLKARIYGQDYAIKRISDAVKMSYAGVSSVSRPLGVFLLAGPTGTGKTETAAAFAEILLGGEQNLITINMSEFKESHTVSLLKGAPPGYIGYGKGGVLTEAVRKRPRSVVLLDEFEKAHSDIHQMFYQIFDKGWMEDSDGRPISFRDCFIILTSNAGAEDMLSAYLAHEVAEQARLEEQGEKNFEPQLLKLSTLNNALNEGLTRHFPDSLLARLTIVPYMPLGIEELRSISEKVLGNIKTQIHKNRGISIEISENVSMWIAKRIQNSPNSGRAVEALLRSQILPKLSEDLISANGKTIESIVLSVKADQLKIEVHTL